MWLLDWSFLTVQKGRKASECEMTHIHISNWSGLTALKSKLQMILPHVQIPPSVCKHLLVTSVRATYWEARFVSPDFIRKRVCCSCKRAHTSIPVISRLHFDSVFLVCTLPDRWRHCLGTKILSDEWVIKLGKMKIQEGKHVQEAQGLFSPLLERRGCRCIGEHILRICWW